MKIFGFLLWTIACGVMTYETWPYAGHIVAIMIAILWLFTFMVATDSSGGISSSGDSSWFNSCDGDSSDCDSNDTGCSD